MKVIINSLSGISIVVDMDKEDFLSDLYGKIDFKEYDECIYNNKTVFRWQKIKEIFSQKDLAKQEAVLHHIPPAVPSSEFKLAIGLRKAHRINIIESTQQIIHGALLANRISGTFCVWTADKNIYISYVDAGEQVVTRMLIKASETINSCKNTFTIFKALLLCETEIDVQEVIDGALSDVQRFTILQYLSICFNCMPEQRFIELNKFLQKFPNNRSMPNLRYELTLEKLQEVQSLRNITAVYIATNHGLFSPEKLSRLPIELKATISSISKSVAFFEKSSNPSSPLVQQAIEGRNDVEIPIPKRPESHSASKEKVNDKEDQPLLEKKEEPCLPCCLVL